MNFFMAKVVSLNFSQIVYLNIFKKKLLRIVCIRELLKGESEGLLKLPSDRALLDDPDFRSYVELYAKVMLDIFVDDWLVKFFWLTEIHHIYGLK